MEEWEAFNERRTQNPVDGLGSRIDGVKMTCW
jgi:hypothetical protein